MYVAYTQEESVRRTAQPRQSCLQREEERGGGKQLQADLNINKLYEASVKKEKKKEKKGFGEDSEGLPYVFPPSSAF